MKKDNTPIKNQTEKNNIVSSAFYSKLRPGARLSNLVQLFRRLVDIEMKKLSLSTTQWRTLLWINTLGSCSQKDLLRHLDIDAAHLTRILEQFDKKEYIIRTPIKGDRRSLFIELTEYCKSKIIGPVEAIIKQENSFLFKGLSDEEKEFFANLLEKLEKNVQSRLAAKREAMQQQ